MIKQVASKHLTLSHEHFILDAELKKLDFTKRHETTMALAADLLAGLQMEELGPLQIFDATDERFPGWSFIQPITTSHFSGHYFEEVNGTSHIHMDIYSCTSFDWKSVINILQKHLPLSRWSANFIVRGIGVMSRKVLEMHLSSEQTTVQTTKVALQMA